MSPPLRAGVPQKKGIVGPDGLTDSQRRADNTWKFLCPVEYCPYHPSKLSGLETHLKSASATAQSNQIRILCDGCYYLFCGLYTFTHHRCKYYKEKAPVPSTAVLYQKGVAFDIRPIPDSDKNIPLIAAIRAGGKAPKELFDAQDISTMPPHQTLPTENYHLQQSPQQMAHTYLPGSYFGQLQLLPDPTLPSQYHSRVATDHLDRYTHQVAVPNHMQYALPQIYPNSSPSAQTSTNTITAFAPQNSDPQKHQHFSVTTRYSTNEELNFVHLDESELMSMTPPSSQLDQHSPFLTTTERGTEHISNVLDEQTGLAFDFFRPTTSQSASSSSPTGRVETYSSVGGPQLTMSGQQPIAAN